MVSVELGRELINKKGFSEFNGEPLFTKSGGKTVKLSRKIGKTNYPTKEILTAVYELFKSNQKKRKRDSFDNQDQGKVKCGAYMNEENLQLHKKSARSFSVTLRNR
jgi:hypothetical protein